MLKDKIKIKTTVVLCLSADDWQLFTNSMDCGFVALSLNVGVADAINHADTRREAEHAAEKVLERYADYGAADSEPFHVLDEILDRVFPE